jgi:hypothetical protein
MKALESLKAMAAAPTAASPAMGGEEEESEDPKRAEMLQHADDLMAAIKSNDREAVADVLEACMGGGSYGSEG